MSRHSDLKLLLPCQRQKTTVLSILSDWVCRNQSLDVFFFQIQIIMKCCTDEPLFAILLFLFSNIKISRNKINNAKTTFFDLDLLNAYATVVPITQCLYFVYRKYLLFYCIFTNYWSLVVIVPDFCTWLWLVL